MRIADVPFGGVARSLAAYLISEDVEEFQQRFGQSFEEETSHPSTQLPEPFVFAEYFTFARDGSSVPDHLDIPGGAGHGTSSF